MGDLTQAVEKATGDRSPAAFLLAAQTSVVGVFASLQVTGDLFQRMVSNHPWLTGFAIGLASLATALALVALILGGFVTKGLLIAGTAAFLAGACCAVAAATLVSSDRGKPILTLNLSIEEGTLTAVGSVKLSNLKTDETLLIRVERLIVQKEDGPVVYTRADDPLFEMAVGPDSTGNVDQPINVALPPGSYTYVGLRAWVGKSDNCYAEESKTTSCATRELQRRPERPQLTTLLRGSQSKTRLVLNVSARDLDPDASLYLHVNGEGKKSSELLTWSLAPDRNGSITRGLSLRIRRQFREVCVVASTAEPDADECSGSVQETVWAKFDLRRRRRS